MRTINKKIVTNEEMRPIAVQIDYADWLEIERLLGMHGEEKSEARRSRFQELLERTRGSWKGGDGLVF